MITITRKIQLNLINADKETYWKQLYSYQNIVHQAANLISTHQFCLDRIKDMLYLTEDIKYKIANSLKEETGILTTSKMNATYQLCSSIYKSKIPMAIITSVNSNVVKNYNKEQKDYYIGKKSLRSYRSTIPIPFPAASITSFVYDKEKKNYRINLFDFEFITYLGADKSGNKKIIDRCLSGEYKLCDSSLKIEKSKLFLLLTCQFEKEEVKLKESNICTAELSFNEPVILSFKSKKTIIGNKEDYVYKRLQIQQKLIRLQKSLKHNNGGHGRKLKLQAIDRFKLKEKNYIDNKLHNYSRQMIDFCVKNGCKTLRLVDIDNLVKDLKDEENKFVLRNWTYFGFLEKIKYKANVFGIDVEIH